MKVYSLAAKYYARKSEEQPIVSLISSIQSSGLSQETVKATCDEVLIMAVHILTEENARGTQKEKLIKLIADPAAKV